MSSNNSKFILTEIKSCKENSSIKEESKNIQNVNEIVESPDYKIDISIIEKYKKEILDMIVHNGTKPEEEDNEHEIW